MLHLGDIQKIDGHKIPIVDCVTFGAPCQDLSVAGKRAGLRHKDLGDEEATRSGLFMDAIRIIKEMREQDVRDNGRADELVRPRYAVYENVPGAFSSNQGRDFQIVLEEIARIKDKDAVIPMPDKGKWQTSGCIMGDGWSIAWRVLDAQFWGAPQRRRRIALVADFGGHSAPQILFVPQSVSRNPQPGKPQGKTTPADATRGIGADDIFCIDGDKLNKKERDGGSGMGYREGSQYTLTAKDVHGVAYDSAAYTMKIRSGVDVDSHGKSAGKGALIQTEKSGTISCVQDQYLFQPVIYDARGNGDGNTSCNLTSRDEGSIGDYSNLVCTHAPVCSVENHPADSRVDIDDSGKVQTLTSRMGTGGGNVPMVMESTECVIALDRASYNQGKNAQFDIGINENGTAQSLVAKGPGAVYALDQQGGKGCANYAEDVMPTLCSDSHGTPHAVAYSLDPLSSNSMKSSNPHSGCHQTDVARTIDTTNPDPSKNQGGVAIVAAVDCRNGTEDGMNGALQSMASNNINSNNVVSTRYTVRRLTPLECERLQGYPDGWTDIGEYIDSNSKKKQSSDAARYKALGNSIALPPWKWVMKRLCACYERDATLASLFDGIGGFPYIWEQINGKGSCLWASEIEEFPIAVTKVRIGE